VKPKTVKYDFKTDPNSEKDNQIFLFLCKNVY
jgi:hypothetical protein